MATANPTANPVPPGPAAAPALPGRDPEELRAATARMNALGIDGEVVFSSADPDELRAYLGTEAPCGSSG